MTEQEALVWAKRRLEAVSGEDAAVDARELVSFVTKRRVRGAGEGCALTAEQENSLDFLVKRRLAHEPLQYIIGEWDFCGLTFKVNSSVLIPRQDTETLAEEAERLIAVRGYKTLLDICTGSGCIGIALQRRTGIRTALADISPSALEIARRNVESIGAECEIIKSDLFEAFSGRSFDIITINPPYIPSETVKTLSDEVKKEPLIALDGGADGLSFYRRIAAEYRRYLNEGGSLLMEIGFDQGKSVPALFTLAQGAMIKLVKDISGNDRVVSITLI